MSTNTNTYGPFANSVRLLGRLDQTFVHQLIDATNKIPGFLCNAQIPIMWDMASRITGEMVEVGVWKGRTSAVLAAGGYNNLIIHCVDTFMGSEEHQAELQGRSTKEEFLENTKAFGNVHVIQKTSVEAAKEFFDKSLDAVFIDGSHDYDNVKLDIISWTPKIRSGGIIMGHDYPNPQDPNGGFQELFKAVNELVRDDNKNYNKFGYVAGLWGAYIK